MFLRYFYSTVAVIYNPVLLTGIRCKMAKLYLKVPKRDMGGEEREREMYMREREI